MFFFCLFLALIGHTSSSPTAYSPSRTETNSSGVPLIRTSVRTWFLLRAGDLCLNCLSCCVHKVTYGTLKGDTTCTGVSGCAKLFVETVASPWRKENVKIHIVWRTSVNSGLCVWIFMVDKYYVYIWRIAWLRACPAGRYHQQLLMALRYCITINRPLVLEGELSYVHETWLSFLLFRLFCCYYCKGHLDVVL